MCILLGFCQIFWSIPYYEALSWFLIKLIWNKHACFFLQNKLQYQRIKFLLVNTSHRMFGLSLGHFFLIKDTTRWPSDKPIILWENLNLWYCSLFWRKKYAYLSLINLILIHLYCCCCLPCPQSHISSFSYSFAWPHTNPYCWISLKLLIHSIEPITTHKCTYMHAHVNKLFSGHFIILKGEGNNNNLCWIAKVCVEIKSNQLKNVLTHHKLIRYVLFCVSNHSRMSWLVISLSSIYHLE